MSIKKLHIKSLNKAQPGGDFRFRPRYMPTNYGLEAGNFNLGDVFNVLKSGYQDFFSGKDADNDGFKDGIFRDMKNKRTHRKTNVIPQMYNYKVMYDADTTPGDYQYNVQDLFKASRFGNRLLGKNTINPTGTLNYSNLPDDPNNTFFTGYDINFNNTDVIGGDNRTDNPRLRRDMLIASDAIMGTDFANMKENKLQNIFKNIGSGLNKGVNAAGDFINKTAEDVTGFTDKLGNDMSVVFKDLVDKGELTLEDIKNKSENFIEKMENFYRDDIKTRLNFQPGGENPRRNVRSYDQNRLLEIKDILDAGNISDGQRKELIAELTSINTQEENFLSDIRNYMENLDDNMYDLPSRLDYFSQDSVAPGAGLIREPLFNWLNENQGAACNTYACAILNDAGVTYPINMEPMTINNRTYRGGDLKAIIPGNLQQDSTYNYKTGDQGFVMTNFDDKLLPGDYGRINYPQTAHAVLYTGEEAYTPEGQEQRYKSVYNPGGPSTGLKVGDYYRPTSMEADYESDNTNTARYVGNTLFINELLQGLQPTQKEGQQRIAEAETKTIPKGQEGFPFDFNFTGTPIPVMEDQTTYTANPNFDFASILNPFLNNQPTEQEVNEQADLDLQARFPALGPTPAQQQGIDRSSPVIANTESVQVGIENPEPPEVQGVTVKRDFGKGLDGLKNRVFTGLNRFEDSAAFKGFEKGSEFAVAAASVVNDMFQDKKIAEAEKEMRQYNMADNQFGVSERTDRGLYDTNTGLLRPDMTTTTSYGKDGGEVEVDELTLKQLIAAGADIEIIE